MSAEVPPNTYMLPLFPLNFVLFPEFTVQLHIFEDRYREMIRECVERQTPFGVILIREGDEIGAPAVPYEVGCTARILAVKHEDDGRMHILAVGGERFRLIETSLTGSAYLVGRVRSLEDDPSADVEIARRVNETKDLFRRYMQLLEETAHFELPELDLPDDPVLLAFTVIAISQLHPHDKQRLLATTDTRERLDEGNLYLREQIAEIEALRNGGLSEIEDESTAPFAVASPLDLCKPEWQSYRRDGRN